MSPEGLLLLFAALSSFVGGVVNSILGERYVLTRLSRCTDLPKLFGNANYTIRVLRASWHSTTIAWWGAAALFFCMAQAPLNTTIASKILAVTFLLVFLVTFFISRGRHIAWPVFAIISAIAFWGAHTL